MTTTYVQLAIDDDNDSGGSREWTKGLKPQKTCYVDKKSSIKVLTTFILIFFSS